MRISTLVGWILIGLYASASGYAQVPIDVEVSLPPGEYAEDVKLSVVYPSPTARLLYRFTDSLDPAYVPYRVPLVLSALEGEDRRYELEYRVYQGNLLLKEGKVTYRIDKRPPSVPTPSVESGEYWGKCTVTFRKDPEADVFFAVTKGEKPTFSPWKGEPIILESGPIPTRVTLLYYGKDKVGNTSRVESRTLTLYPETPPLDSFFKILSPVEGSFFNPQVLWIEHRGYEWIRYRINDAPEFKTYQHPVLVEPTGFVKVEISAKRLFSPIIETKVIRFRQENQVQDLPPSGVYSLEDEVTLPLGKGKYRYNLADRPVEWYDPETADGLSLYPTVGYNRVVVIRLKPTSAVTEGEYRYLVELKGEVPGDVVILFDEKQVYRGKVWVTLRGRPGTSVYYTLDGSLPTTESFLYDAPFEVSFPPQGEGFLTLRVRARSGQKWGPVAEKFLEYDTVPPPEPSPKLYFEKPSGYATLELSSLPNGEGIYEIAWGGKEPQGLSLTSPVLNPKQSIRVPYGYKGVAKLRLAYRDRAGNITEYPQVLTLSFDRVPPPVPQIAVKDRFLTLTGEGSLFYHIFETTGSLEGELPEIESISFRPYSKPIELPAPEGRMVQYRILAYAEDEAGNRSEWSVPYTVSFDRRVPLSLQPGGPQGPSIPVTNKEFILSFPDPKGDLEVFYTFTEDGSEPPDPTSSSPKGASTLRFFGQPGKRILYTVKVWARYRGSLEKGQIQTYQFVIDRDPPNLPKVLGIDPPVRNRGAWVRFGSSSPSHRVFFRVFSQKEEKDLPWMPYTEPFLLDVEEGKEATFFLSYRVTDDAGNSVEVPEPVKVVIDKKPPLAPRVEVKDGISLRAPEGKIYYELTTDGSLPPVPTEKSPSYVRELPRDVTNGSYITLAARTRDEGGNWSEVVYVTDIPSLPLQPSRTPSVYTLSLGNYAVLTWEENSSVSLVGLDPQEGFSLKEVKNPWIVESSKEREVLIQGKGQEGRSRDPVKVKLVSPPPAVPVLISGGEKGEYDRGIQLQNLENGAILRYEISTGNLPPRKVDALSPRMERPLTLDTLPEETVLYRIQVQNFSKNNLPLSPAQEFTVKIDRTPPPPPQLVGVEGGASYGQDVSFSLQAKEGTVFYLVEGVEEGKDPPPLPKENQFKPFDKPIGTSVPEGTSRVFWVSSFTRDSVGNVSRHIQRWSFMVDKQYLYVIEGKGVEGKGTRVAPFTNLETALEAASKGTRTRIRIATGTYRITKPIIVRRDLVLFGGFDRNGWKPEGGTSKILIDPHSFKDVSAYFSMEGANLKVDRVTIEGGDGKGKAIFSVRNGTLEFSSGSVTVWGKDRVLDLGNGKVTLHRSTFQSNRMEADALLTVSGGTFQSKESSFSYQKSERGAPLFQFLKSSVVLESVTLSPGEGETSVGIDAKDSVLKIQFSTINTGSGTLAAYGLRLKGGTLTMDRSEIKHAPAAYISIGVGLFESKGEITGSTFRIGGRYGAQALQARRTELVIRESLLEGASTEDYIYYGTFEDSSLRFIGNVVRKGSSAEITGFQLLNSRMEGEKNTFDFGTSTRGFSGFVLKGKSDLFLKGNELIDSDPKGVLFLLPREEIRVVVAENKFQVKGAYRELRQGGRRILLNTLKDLEASSTEQVRFERNRN